MMRTLRANGPGGTPMANATLLFYAIAAWLLVHSYRGVEHDAALYAGQAIAWLHPEAFRHDLFFAFGSQDDFTLFTPLFAGLLRWLPLGDAALLLVVLAHVVWVGAAVVLVHRLFRNDGLATWLGIVLVLGGFPAWGPQTVLAYGEGYITARVWAEAFALIAVSCSLSGQRLAALLTCALSLALHPIIALPAVGFVAFHGFRPRQLLSAGALALITVGIGLAMGQLSFSRLFGVMDPDWYEIVFNRAPYILVTTWSTRDINHVLALFAVLITAALSADERLKRVWIALLATGAIGMGLALVAAGTHHALLMQMQTWRVLWLLRIFAALAAIWLVFAFWPRGQAHRLILMGLAFGWLVKDYWGGALALSMPLVLLFRSRWEGHSVPRSIVITAWLAVIAAVLNTLVAEVQQTLVFLYQNIAGLPPSRLPAAQIQTVSRQLGGVIFPLLLWPVWRLAHGGKTLRPAIFVAAWAMAFLAAGLWNQRSPAERDITSSLAREAEPLVDFFPGNALVYWENNHRIPWFVLHRGNYASGPQTAGLLFSRQTALEARQRIGRLALLGMRDAGISWTGKGAPGVMRETTFAGLLHACHDPVLDFVVLSTSFPEGRPRVFPQNEHYAYHVYDCRMLRQAFLDPIPPAPPAAGAG